jgi:hypothetical protein
LNVSPFLVVHTIVPVGSRTFREYHLRREFLALADVNHPLFDIDQGLFP